MDDLDDLKALLKKELPASVKLINDRVRKTRALIDYIVASDKASAALALPHFQDPQKLKALKNDLAAETDASKKGIFFDNNLPAFAKTNRVSNTFYLI